MTTELTEAKKHAYCQKAMELKKDIEWKFLDLGKMLFDIKRELMFEAGWSSWEEYCMELKLSAATISKLLHIYEVFVVFYGIKPEQLAEAGGWSSVAELLPLVKPETTPRSEVTRLLGIVIKQPRTEARKTIGDEIRGAPCKHKQTRLLLLEICEDGCNERWNVTDNYDLKRK